MLMSRAHRDLAEPREPPKPSFVGTVGPTWHIRSPMILCLGCNVMRNVRCPQWWHLIALRNSLLQLGQLPDTAHVPAEALAEIVGP